MTKGDAAKIQGKLCLFNTSAGPAMVEGFIEKFSPSGDYVYTSCLGWTALEKLECYEVLEPAGLGQLEALRRIKLCCLTVNTAVGPNDAAVALESIRRLCIDAGVKEGPMELRGLLDT